MAVAHLSVAVLKNHIGHSELFSRPLINLRLPILKTIVQMIFAVILEPGIVRTVAAGIFFRSAGPDHGNLLSIRIFRPDAVRCKGELGYELLVIFPVIAETVHSLHQSVDEKITGKFRGIARTADPSKGFVRRLFDPLHTGTDVLHRVAVDQISHIGNRKSPVAVNGLIAHSGVYKIIPAASHGTDVIQLVKILKNPHQTGNPSLHGSLINDARTGKPVLRHGLGVVGNHHGDGPSGDHLFILPFPGQVALHLSVHHFPLPDYRQRFFLHAFCLRFGLRRRFHHSLRFRRLCYGFHRLPRSAAASGKNHDTGHCQRCHFQIFSHPFFLPAQRASPDLPACLNSSVTCSGCSKIII